MVRPGLMVALAVAASALVPLQAPARVPFAPCFAKKGKGGSPRPPAPESGEGMSAKAAAKLAAAALARPKKAPAAESAAGAGDDAPAKKPSAKQKIAARRGGRAAPAAAAEEETPARNSARRKGGSLELEPEDRAKLRGVAAAEDAYNAAELLQEQALAGSERNGAYDALDASEVAAAQAYFNATLWPSAVLVGLELTSRRGAAKLAEQRGRGAKSSYAASLAASGGAAWTVADSLAELARLCETARVRAVDATFQRADAANGQYLVGKGKIEEVARKVLDHGADAVVFDDELSLAQQRSVLAVLAEAGCDDKVQILDRTQLVLQIFSERAQTREAKAQIALARAEYMLPRLTTFLTGAAAGTDAKSGGRGAGGGAYLRGAGESQLEMDRRLFGKRIAKLKAELGAIASKRAVARSKKLDKEDLPLVALIGYTNAGKTSLLNALSEAAPLYADDRLFATLDPATRRVTLPSGRACKLTDTVGFIQKLPTKLVASFRATLEEIADACLLVHVVDASSPLADGQMRAVYAILHELDCFDMPQITVYNKQDRVGGAPAPPGDDVASATTLLDLMPPEADEVRVSCQDGTGIRPLLGYVDAALGKMNAKVHCLLPFDQGTLVEEIHRTATVDEVEHLAQGTRIVARVPPSLEQRLRPFAVPV